MNKYDQLLKDGACAPIMYQIDAETLKKVNALKKKVVVNGTRI